MSLPDSSFIDPFWTSAYLDTRDSVVNNSNPLLVIDTRGWGARGGAGSFSAAAASSTTSSPSSSRASPPPPSPTAGEGLAAVVAAGMIEWAVARREGRGVIDTEKDQELCMFQPGRMMGTTRIPRVGTDWIVTTGNSTHIVVMSGGRYYRVEAVKPGTRQTPVSAAELVASFRAIRAQGASDHQGSALVGYGTALERDRWARLRKSLEAHSPANARSLAEIDAALFIVNLDEPGGSSPRDSSDVDAISQTFLHNRGHNRHFDKSLQLIVTASGVAGVNFEHSPHDGHAVVCMIEQTCESIAASGGPILGAAAPAAAWRPLAIAAGTDELARELELARRDASEELAQCRSVVLEHRGIGKERIKSMGMSPDAFLQMAFQLTYFDTRPRGADPFVSAYESCNTRNFRRGRTEAIRSTSVEAQRFVEAIALGRPWKHLLREASVAHSATVALAKAGQGVDRHLYALQCVATKAGLPMPALFSDPNYRKPLRNVLSTSGLSSKWIAMFGFGPVVPEGLGLAYGIHGDSIQVTISDFKSTCAVSASAYKDRLAYNLERMAAPEGLSLAIDSHSCAGDCA